MGGGGAANGPWIDAVLELVFQQPADKGLEPGMTKAKAKEVRFVGRCVYGPDHAPPLTEEHILAANLNHVQFDRRGFGGRASHLRGR